MRRKLISFFTAVLIAGLVIPAFSAVENVKVGGDLTISGIYRSSFDCIDDDISKDQQHYLYSGVRVYVSAELTNNVSAMVRLINERDWGQTTSAVSGDNDLDVNLDLAYIKVKDIMTPGLSLTLGRQEIQIGEGLVVGSAYTCGAYNVNTNTLATDLGLQKAFDAVRVDYVAAGAPVSVFGFMAKVNEDYGGVVTAGTTGDITLYGAELLWKGANFTVEPYYVALTTAYEAPAIENDLMVGGVRGTWNVLTIPGLDLKGEFAHEFGDAGAGDYTGWAGYFGATYEFAHHMKPTITLGYNYYSGDDDATDVEQWVPVFPSNVADRIGMVAYPALFAFGEGILTGPTGTGLGATPATGLQAIKLGFGLTPVEKIKLGLTWYNLAVTDAGTDGGPLSRISPDKGLGNEIDFTVDYAYTEDLSFGLAIGYLMVGDHIEDVLGNPAATAQNDQNPWEAVVTAKLAF